MNISTVFTPFIGLAVALSTLLFLVLRTRIHVLIALLIAATIAGLSGGLTIDKTLAVISQGFGTTLSSIGIVIGLGVMMGRILEVSGAAEQIAHCFICWVGQRREAWALAMTGYIVSIPVFVDSAFIILFPIAKTIAQKGGRSLLTLGIALAGGLVITHHMVPPTPGPLGVAGLFGVNIGQMILLGMVLAIPCVVVMVLYAQWLAKRYPHFTLPQPTRSPTKPNDNAHQPRELPSLARSLLPIWVPILLILLKSSIGLLQTSHLLPLPQEHLIFHCLSFLGSPIIALSISTLLAIYTLTPTLNRQQTAERLEEGLQSAGIVLLVTGTGGALGAILRESGTAQLIANHIVHLPLPAVLIPFIIATFIRLVQGSGTVAMITAASISAPILMHLPQVNLLVAAQAATAGALCCSSFHDSLFWVVNRLMGVKESSQQIMVWSVPTTLAWLTSLAGILICDRLL